MQTGTLESSPPVDSTFHTWFEGSKVVDEAGDPLPVFHGTPHGEFERFDMNRAGCDSFGSVWFTECEGQALIYALGQKTAPYSIRPMVQQLREQKPGLSEVIDTFVHSIRITTYPDGTPWESFDRDWICRKSTCFDYAAALRSAYPEEDGPRIHRAFLRATNPYIGADERIAGQVGAPHCVYDSYLSVMAPYPEWAVPSACQIRMIPPGTSQWLRSAGLTYGMAHSAAGLREAWSYDSASSIARTASWFGVEHVREHIRALEAGST